MAVLLSQSLNARARKPLQTLTVGVPKVAFQVSTDAVISDFILQIEHNVRLDTKGAYVAEWDEDQAGFLAAHLPLSKMGTGQATIRRPPQARGRSQATKPSIELHKGGVALAKADKNSVLVDAHAFKEQAGLTRPAHDNNRAPDNARDR